MIGDGDHADAAMLEVNAPAKPEAAIVAALGRRSIVLVGMMGAGKSSVGRRLAARLGLIFVDADNEIEAAAGMSIADIFAAHGEAYFRSGEARVIARLLEGGPQVMATGGGSMMNPDTRALIRVKGVSVWLDAEYEVLLRRVKRRTDRPMLKTADPAETLRRLLGERKPVYSQADVILRSRDAPHETIVNEAIAALASHFDVGKQSAVRG
jgi:shikimate kinase